VSAVGDTVYWLAGAKVLSGVLLKVTGQGPDAVATVKVSEGINGGTKVPLVDLRPTAKAAQASAQTHSKLGGAYMPVRRAAPAPPPDPLERVISLLERILQAVTPEPTDPDAIPWVIPDAKGLSHDVMGGMAGGKIQTFKRAKDRLP